MLPRDQLVAVLEAAFGDSDLDVKAHVPNQLDQLVKPTVLVGISTVAPTDRGVLGFRVYAFELVLLTPHTDAAASDNDLDPLLEDLLLVLEQAPALVFTGARRGTYEDTGRPTYFVDVTVNTQHESE